MGQVGSKRASRGAPLCDWQGPRQLVVGRCASAFRAFLPQCRPCPHARCAAGHVGHGGAAPVVSGAARPPCSQGAGLAAPRSRVRAALSSLLTGAARLPPLPLSIPILAATPSCTRSTPRCSSPASPVRLAALAALAARGARGGLVHAPPAAVLCTSARARPAHAAVLLTVVVSCPPPPPEEHDQLDITAGYPYPGRPQIGSGDNVSWAQPACRGPAAAAAAVHWLLCLGCCSAAARRRLRCCQGSWGCSKRWAFKLRRAALLMPLLLPPPPAAVSAGPHPLPHVQRRPARPRCGQQRRRGHPPR